MAKRHLLILGLLLGGSALASACSDTKATGIDGDTDAAGEAGAKSEGGSGNASSGGHAGSVHTGGGNAAGEAGGMNEGGMGGESAQGGEGGEAEPPYVFPPSLNPQAVLVIGPAASTSSTLLVGGTDYATKSEIVSVTIDTGVVGDRTTYDDGDTLATSSGGIGFAIERTNDKVHQLDAGKVVKTFDLKDLGTNKPVAGSKAYVPLYNQSFISILDLSEGTVSRRIDLNLYNAPGDSDHSADISEGVYDPNSKIAYFLLQRIDINAIKADPKFELHCADRHAMIVAVDTRIDDVIDLNGEAPGKGIELKLVNPNSLSMNRSGDHLYLLANGCFDGDTKVQQGVEVVDLSDGSTTIAYQATGLDYLSRMIMTVGAEALIQSSDASYATHWHKIDLAQGTLGNEIMNVPHAPSFDGNDLLGVEVAGKVGKVVRYKIATETSTEISPTSWGGEYSSASSTALVK